MCKSPFLLHLPPTNLEWSASLFSLYCPPGMGPVCKQHLASQQVDQRNGSQKSYPWGKFPVGLPPLCGEGWLVCSVFVDHCVTTGMP